MNEESDNGFNRNLMFRVSGQLGNRFGSKGDVTNRSMESGRNWRGNPNKFANQKFGTKSHKERIFEKIRGS